MNTFSNTTITEDQSHLNDELIEFELSESNLAEIQTAADSAGITISEFIIQAVRRELNIVRENDRS